MVARDEAALRCDFLETYHIFDFRALPARQAALFACGLREDSRIMRVLSGAKQDMQTTLLAIIADALQVLVWQHTEDGQKGRNRPKSILDALQGAKKESGLCEGFDSAAAFEAWRETMLTGGD